MEITSEFPCKFWHAVPEKDGLISWSDHLKNENVMYTMKGGINSLHTIKRRKANSIGHVLCKNCLLEHFIAGEVQGKLEAMGR